AERGGRARQCKTECGSAKQRPAAEIVRRDKPQSGSFPKPDRAVASPNSTPERFLSCRRHKMVSGRLRIVQSDLLQCYQKFVHCWKSVAQMPDVAGSLPRNSTNRA